MINSNIRAKMPLNRENRLVVCGTVNWDTLLFVDQLPLPGEEVRVNRVISVPGGKGGNTAVSAARIMGMSKVALLASVGRDPVGSKHMRLLQGEGVDTTSILKEKGYQSGQAFIAIDKNGQDVILTHMAANAQLGPQSLARSTRAGRVIKKASAFVITDPPLATAIWLARRAKRQGAMLILSPAMLTLLGFEALEEYLRLGDYVIVNEQEAGVLLGTVIADTDKDIKRYAALSLRLKGKKVIVTLGRLGCALFHESKAVSIPTLDLALFGLKVVSTAGAGDAFVGTFAAYKAMGLDDADAILRANFAAALKTTKTVVRGSPRRSEIERYMGLQTRF